LRHNHRLRLKLGDGGRLIGRERLEGLGVLRPHDGDEVAGVGEADLHHLLEDALD